MQSAGRQAGGVRRCALTHAPQLVRWCQLQQNLYMLTPALPETLITTSLWLQEVSLHEASAALAANKMCGTKLVDLASHWAEMQQQQQQQQQWQQAASKQRVT